MDILPAIDLLAGEAVRLSQGDYERPKVYSPTPASVAGEFTGAGATWIHVVDLDAARSGKGTNHEAIRAIRQVAQRSAARVELGGGARDEDTIAFMLENLADRVVIGSAAVKNWPWFEALLASGRFPRERLALGLDARGGKVAAEGWREQLSATAVELARRVTGSGLGAIVYTDIARDGMLSGVNVEATRRVMDATDVPVIASGGVASMEDIRRCKAAGCSGVIVGRAWYEGKIDIAEALAVAGENSP